MKILGLRNTLIASAFALIVGSCIAPPVDPAEKHDTGWLPGGGLEMVQPADIAVIPISLRTKDTAVPTDQLREKLYGGLLDRLYTPLPFSWVDGGGESDAELQVTMLRWDRTDLAARGAILARAEARMVQGADVLWAVEITREVSANSFGGDARTNVGVAEARCAEVFAGEILALLPVRDAMAAQ
ncbi:MAG: hypothetical protein ACI9D0_001179 [Bacteroidia bacterium]|jgi:hypothetical protein